LLRDCFGGTFSNQLSAEGGHLSERPEPFYFISVEVGNGKVGLEDSLTDFIKGESVEYSWAITGDDGKVLNQSLPTVKKTMIKKLPPHLIFHLRRFDFDYETCRLAKKNDRFEFPLELNMHPFTTAAEESESEGDQCLYQLSGVVTHIGTTESG
jgi:ubiquitin carboxyl-terminal hydrolase 34